MQTCRLGQQPVQFLQAASSRVVVVGHIEANARVRCIGQQLSDHDGRAQFIHEGFLVVTQTSHTDDDDDGKWISARNARQHKKVQGGTYMKEQPRAATKLSTGKV